MSITVTTDFDNITEQNKNIITENPKIILSSIEKILEKDNHNLFSIRAKQNIDTELENVNTEISKLIKMKVDTVDKIKIVQKQLSEQKKRNQTEFEAIKKNLGN